MPKTLIIDFALVVAALIVVATAVKWYETRAARHWLPARGRILSSQAVQRRVTASTGDVRGRTELRNFPSITYEFHVGGRRYRGNRHSLGEDLGNTDVAATLARYPKGTEVVVYYDPANPSDSVIERDMPEGIIRTLGLFAAFIVFGTVAATLGIDNLIEWIRPHLPRPDKAAPAAILAVLGLVVLRIGFVLRGQVAASRRWFRTAGRIVSSGHEEVRLASRGRTHRAFRPQVVYRYEAGGQIYAGERVAFGATVVSTAASWLGDTAARYPEGAEVEVFYNPLEPSDAVLERRAAGLWLVWLVAGLLIAGATSFAGLL